MRRLLIATLLLLLLALPAASALAADNPDDLLVDACRDEQVDGTYSQRTYRRALDELPADSDQYSACRDVINRARLAALNAPTRSSSGGGGSSSNSGAGGAGGGNSGSGSSNSGAGAATGTTASTGSTGSNGSTSTGRSTGGGRTTTRPCNGCTGSGTALDTATPKERRDVETARASGSKPVVIGGELLKPGTVGSLSSDSHTLPTSLVVLLAALAACALAAGGALGWNRVIARRPR